MALFSHSFVHCSICGLTFPIPIVVLTIGILFNDDDDAVRAASHTDAGVGASDTLRLKSSLC